MNKTLRGFMFGGAALAMTTFAGVSAAVAAQKGSVSVPVFTTFVGSQPSYDVYPSFLESYQILHDGSTGLPALESFSRCAYNPEGKRDSSITKLQIESDVTGYFGIFQKIDGNDFAIIKPQSDDPSKPINKWVALGVINGEYKAAVCNGYDAKTGLLSDCMAAPHIALLVTQNSLNVAVDYADKMCGYHIENAAKMGAFSPPPAPKPAEKQQYIDNQRKNLGQLAR